MVFGLLKFSKTMTNDGHTERELVVGCRVLGIAPDIARQGISTW